MFNWLRKEYLSFGYAFRGLALFLKSETHAKVHIVATIVVVSLGFLWDLSFHEWALIIFAIGIVWMAEIFNTAIEKLVDKLWIERNPRAAFIKDVAAAGVLVAALTAAIIGFLVFIPHLLR